MEGLLHIAALLCCVTPASFTQLDLLTAAPGAEEEACEVEWTAGWRAPLVSVLGGGGVALSCGAHRFAAYPRRAALLARCEAGRYRVQEDGALRPLRELLCTDSVLQDAPYPAHTCSLGHEGRAYQASQEGGARCVAALCYDAERAVPAAAALLPPQPAARAARASLYLALDYMVSARSRAAAERVFVDDASLAARLHAVLRARAVPLAALADQSLTAARLLAPLYFDEPYRRLANSWSNKVAVWRSVAAGNLRRVQRDVAALRARAPGLHVLAGAAGVAALRDERADNTSLLYLHGERFPVPEYIWTLVVEPGSRRALAVVVLNDPFVSAGEARAAPPCRGDCLRARWLALRPAAPLLGLTFCCGAHDAAAALPALPAAACAGVPPGDEGLLLDL